jgi:predicted ArsR family transcriptional regulator
MTPQPKTTLKLEDLLCFKTRIKILKLLLRSGQLNTTQIARQVDANYETTRTHLDVLESEGIVQKMLFGSRTRFYRLNEQSAKTQALQTLLKAWSEP